MRSGRERKPATMQPVPAGRSGQPQPPAAPQAAAQVHVPTEHRGVVLRTSDQAYLSLVEVPLQRTAAGQQQQQQQHGWLLLGHFPQLEEAIATRDCVTLGLGLRPPLAHVVRPPRTYT